MSKKLKKCLIFNFSIPFHFILNNLFVIYESLDPVNTHAKTLNKNPD